MQRFRKLFPKTKCAVIGMVHVGALPGTPKSSKTVEKLVSEACKETEIYLKHGIEGILVENMHDVPYIQSRHLNPEITATMTRICTEVKRIMGNLPCGVQVLASGNKEALAVSQASGLDFIRCEGFVFGHIADEGFTDANAGLTLRYRKQIGADVLVFADIKKKHSSHAITGDISLIETAQAAEYFLADGVILTGKATGAAAEAKQLETVKKSVGLPVLVGSGVTFDNLQDYYSADAIIVGSHFKKNGCWDQALDEEKVRLFMEKKRNELKVYSEN